MFYVLIVILYVLLCCHVRRNKDTCYLDVLWMRCHETHFTGGVCRCICRSVWRRTFVRHCPVRQCPVLHCPVLLCLPLRSRPSMSSPAISAFPYNLLALKKSTTSRQQKVRNINPQLLIEQMQFEHSLDSFELLYSLLWICCATSCNLQEIHNKSRQ